MNIDLGVILAALHQQRAEARRCDAIGQRHAQLAVIAGRNGLDALAGLLQGGEDAGNVLQEHLPGARQAGAARGANEQARAEIFLQFLDGARQRRLLDVQPLGRTNEAEFFGYSKKAAQVS